MIREPFAVGDSLIHRLEPRIRVSVAFGYSFVVALSYQLPVLLMALVLATILLIIARVRMKKVLKRMMIANALTLLIWLVLPLSFTGEVLTHIGSFAIYRPGVILSAQITVKSNAILLVFIALIATMPFSTLGHAMRRLGVPAKIVHLLLMTYRYIFVIEQEYQRLIRAAKIRGFQPGTNGNTYRTFAYIIGMLFVRSAGRAERVHQAMICRGFKGKFYSLQEFQINAADWVFSTMMTALIVGLALMEWSTLL